MRILMSRCHCDLPTELGPIYPRFAGANYRKATSADRAFPAALQDAITAYTHLLELGYTDIVLAGDSAGAGEPSPSASLKLR